MFILSYLSYIIVVDLIENTDYHGYTRQSNLIIWFWEILEDLDQTLKACFLQFVTGNICLK